MQYCFQTNSLEAVRIQQSEVESKLQKEVSEYVSISCVCDIHDCSMHDIDNIPRISLNAPQASEEKLFKTLNPVSTALSRKNKKLKKIVVETSEKSIPPISLTAKSPELVPRNEIQMQIESQLFSDPREENTVNEKEMKLEHQLPNQPIKLCLNP
ncbi:hypothetical protein NPIL_464421 [Nephila pilipes]|uniref:Uncharacterized protein n=1 Tax=Nephila pilipes TaxID=299642 RepID=A0A8X6N5Q6_NEPPI|nr:hypothetical protein NPIL_464421 [Nephila pilipes]